MLPSTRRMTPDEVMDLLRHEHARLAQYDLAEEIDLTVDTKVDDWLCWADDMSRLWVGNARRLNALFGIAVPLREWNQVLNPTQSKTLRGVAAFVAAHAIVPEIPTVTILGRSCRTAGAFLTIRALMESQGVDTSQLRPSAPLSRFAGTGLPEVYTTLVRLAPSLVSRFDPVFRSDLAHTLSAAVLLLTTIVGGVVAGQSPLIGLPIAVAAFVSFVFVWRLSEKRIAAPRWSTSIWRSGVGRCETMLNACMIDKCNDVVIIRNVGREDRALLRGNPSARFDAGTGAGAYPHGGSCSPNLFWPESDKPRGFGGSAPKANPGAVGQLSRR